MSIRWNDETQSWETGGGAPGPGPGSGPVTGVGPGHGSASAPASGLGPVVLPPPPPPSYAPEYAPEHSPEHSPEYVPETGEWQYSTASASAPATASRSRSRGAVAAGVAVAVLAAGSVGTWLIWGGGEDGKSPAAGGPPASVSAPDPATESPSDPSSPTDEPSPSDSSSSATPMDDVPPPGYRAVEDLKGFTVAIPEGWDRTESDQGVFYNAPDGRSLLQVFVVTEPGLTPYEALRGASEDGRTNKPGYEEISLDRVTGEPGAPADAAELVYAYSREGGRRKVVDRAFTAADGNHYAILSAGPETDWPKQREVLRVALDFFRPGAH
ncbi:serine/arginine repetitive matrix protein 2 [Streptomyces sp. NBC_00090]|uniref:serine/arginine repetitive matrix protein 2 n=1 Tax=Streptomyces sp. NBC_00090 TaxID=2903619 RepID=UPI003250C4E7